VTKRTIELRAGVLQFDPHACRIFGVRYTPPVRYTLLAAVLSALTACPSKQPVDPTAIPVATHDLKPFMWRVDTSPAPSYLLGSFHVGIDPDEVLPAAVWSKLAAARIVVLEVNMAVPEALGLGRQPPGHSLDQQMTAAQWQELTKLLEVDSEAAAKLKGVKPWVIVTQLIQELVPQTRSIDTVVEQRARDRNTELFFLEDVKFQERLFDKFMTVEMLLKLLANTDRQRKLLAAQADAYRSGDEARMYAEAVAPEVFANSPPGARDELLFDRNRTWVGKLDPMLGGGGLFVVVGASHLIGEGGLVDLLRKRGYTITRIGG
jgi:uncharacterized protein YbaP (TraB family)